MDYRKLNDYSKLLMNSFLSVGLIATYLVMIKPHEIIFVYHDQYFQLVTSIFFSIILLISIFSKKSNSLLFNLIDVFFILFFLYISFNLYLIAGDNFHELTYQSFLIIIIGYFVAKFNHSEIDWYFKNVFIPLLLFTGLLQVVIGLMQISGLLPNLFADFEIGGTLGNPGPFAIFIVCFILISISELLFTKPKSRFYKVYIIVCLFLFLSGIILSKSRTSWIAAFAGIVYLVYLKYGIPHFISSRLNSVKRKILAFFLILSFLMVAGILLYNFKKDSALGRVLIWKNTINVILDHPLLGVGYERFSANVNDYQAKYLQKHPDSKYTMIADDVKFAFNDYLEVTTDFGLIGLLLFLGIFVSVFLVRFNKNEKNREKIIVISLSKTVIIAILICALFSYPMKILPVSFILFYFTGTLSAIYTKGLKINLTKDLTKVIVSIFFCLALAFVFYSYNQLKAAKRWYEANNMFDAGYVNEGLIEYEKLSTRFNGNERFYYNYSDKFMNLNMYDEAIYLLEKAKDKINNYDLNIRLGNCYYNKRNFEKAEHFFIKASNIIPSKLYPKYLLIILYKEFNKEKLCKEKCNEFLEYKSKFYTQDEGNLKQHVIKIIEELNMNKTFN